MTVDEARKKAEQLAADAAAWNAMADRAEAAGRTELLKEDMQAITGITEALEADAKAAIERME